MNKFISILLVSYLIGSCNLSAESVHKEGNIIYGFSDVRVNGNSYNVTFEKVDRTKLLAYSMAHSKKEAVNFSHVLRDLFLRYNKKYNYNYGFNYIINGCEFQKHKITVCYIHTGYQYVKDGLITSSIILDSSLVNNLMRNPLAYDHIPWAKDLKPINTYATWTLVK